MGPPAMDSWNKELLLFHNHEIPLCQDLTTFVGENNGGKATLWTPSGC